MHCSDKNFLVTFLLKQKWMHQLCICLDGAFTSCIKEQQKVDEIRINEMTQRNSEVLSS